MITKFTHAKGFSLIELLVTISVISILMLIAVFGFKDILSPTQSAVDQTLSVYKLAKAKAIANLVAYQLEPNGNDQLEISYRKSCDSAEPWVEDQNMTFNLPEGASFTTTDWSICIDSRGFPNNEEFAITDSNGKTITIEVFLGGGISAT